MHLMRLLLSGISALREGDLRLRLDEERDALLTIKRGERPWPNVNAWRPENMRICGTDPLLTPF